MESNANKAKDGFIVVKATACKLMESHFLCSCSNKYFPNVPMYAIVEESQEVLVLLLASCVHFQPTLAKTE